MHHLVHAQLAALVEQPEESQIKSLKHNRTKHGIANLFLGFRLPFSLSLSLPLTLLFSGLTAAVAFLQSFRVICHNNLTRHKLPVLCLRSACAASVLPPAGPTWLIHNSLPRTHTHTHMERRVKYVEQNALTNKTICLWMTFG